LSGQRVIDCCVLINLHAGWGGLGELRELGNTWYVGEAVLKEAQFTWEVLPDGTRRQIPMDLQAPVQQGVLVSLRPETEGELADYVEFSQELDDGEAQALALAKHRGMVLLTDDRKALRLAQRADINVPTMTTAQLLREWSECNSANAFRLAEVLARVEERANFVPRRGSPDADWWQQKRGP
jgi:predicted nucleic acid-binding protein